MSNGKYGSAKRPAPERGAILPLLAVGMLAVIGVAGMAIDSSHAFVNVTRVQNAADAAALSAAKSLHLFGKDTTLASEHGTETFTDHLYPDKRNELDENSVSVAFEYSNTLSPFNPGGVEPNFVRATIIGHTIPIWFARVLPGVGDNFAISTTAVSGPIPIGGGQVCGIAPLLVCAPDPGDSTGTDTDGDGVIDTLYGMPVGDDAPLQCLKQETHDGGGSGGGGNTTPEEEQDAANLACRDLTGDPTLEAGNFYLSRVNCPGGNCVREALAGNYDACATGGGTIDTEPGNTVGPTAQGLNTRFNQYQGGGLSSADYPPDLVTGAPMTYLEYKAAYASEAWDNNIGEEQRRIMPVPIADCAGIQNGQSTVPLLDFGCYFMTQPVASAGGGSGSNSYIVGQFVAKCEAAGNAGPIGGPITDGGPFEIVLYDDPDNPGS